jgi:hypothetical protein
MRHFLFAPTISYFGYLTMITALVVAHQMEFTPMSVLAWLGITVAGGFIEGFLSEALNHG